MEKEEILNSDKKFRYMMLDRLRSDCNYYLDNGHRHKKFLWANNEEEHIELMVALYESFSKEDKPEWISMDNIEEYRRKMSDNICCYKLVPCCGCAEYETCARTKLSEAEIRRYLKYHPDETRETANEKDVKFWITTYPVISYIPKRNASEFMANVNHLLCKAGMDMMGYIQNYNYYKKFWGEKETCKRFIATAIKEAEYYQINVGISQNDNEAVIVLKDFA